MKEIYIKKLDITITYKREMSYEERAEEFAKSAYKEPVQSSKLSNERRIREINDWFKVRTERGWKLYFLTFLFDQIPVIEPEICMKVDIEKFYAYSLGNLFKNGSNPIDLNDYPLMIFCKDFPIPKNDKKENVTNALINDGLHYHGVIAFPDTKSGMNLQALYARKFEKDLLKKTDYLKVVDIEPITETPENVVKYCLKQGNKLHRFEEPKWEVLPKCNSEMPISKNANQ